MSDTKLRQILQAKLTRKEFLGHGAVAVASLLGVAGVLRQLQSHAATTVVTGEPEAGVLSGGASVVTDTTSSGGKGVKFGTVSTAIWQPTDLKKVVWVRPSGAGFVTWESLVGTTVAAAQAAAPTTPVLLTAAFMKSITGNVVITLPKGIFEAENGWHNYRPTDPNNPNMMGIGSGYAQGLRGIAGSGSRSTPGAGGAETILRMRGKMTGVAGQTPQGNLIVANAVVSPYFGGFSLMGVQARGDNVFHAGIMLNNCSGKPLIERMYFRNANPGYGNAPPGETFGINIFRTPNACVRDTEIDGRDLTGKRTSASPLGWNTVVNDTSTVNVQRVYAHHGLASMLTFWETTNIITEDYYVFSWSSGTGALSGSGINHEQSGGRIRHIRPRLFLNSTKSAGPVGGVYGHLLTDDQTKQANTTSSAFGISSGLSDVGADFEMWYPVWHNTLGSSGILCMAGYRGYALGYALVTGPKIFMKNASGVDYLLKEFDHPNAGWSSQDPLVYYAWIH